MLLIHELATTSERYRHSQAHTVVQKIDNALWSTNTNSDPAFLHHLHRFFELDMLGEQLRYCCPFVLELSYRSREISSPQTCASDDQGVWITLLFGRILKLRSLFLLSFGCSEFLQKVG